MRRYDYHHKIMTMHIFVDTEFTDFIDTERISIGLVTEDGHHEFYGELPVNRSKCSDFVIEHVLPQIGLNPQVHYSVEELDAALRSWLDQFSHLDDVTICYDFSGDWFLFQYALSNKVPDWFVGENVYQHIDQEALAHYFEERGVQEHHALNDAKANRHVWLAQDQRMKPTHEQPHRK